MPQMCRKISFKKKIKLYVSRIGAPFACSKHRASPSGPTQKVEEGSRGQNVRKSFLRKTKLLQASHFRPKPLFC